MIARARPPKEQGLKGDQARAHGTALDLAERELDGSLPVGPPRRGKQPLLQHPSGSRLILKVLDEARGHRENRWETPSMTKTYDYEEIVDVFATSGAPGGPTAGEPLGRLVATLPLYRAVRLIIEEWDGKLENQLGAVIVRCIDRPILQLNDIKAIYRRDDFPRSK